MQMFYNSDSFAVVQFDMPPLPQSGSAIGQPLLTRGGFEIVDKWTRREIFIQGEMAERFKEGVDALIQTRPSEEELDDYMSRYASLMQHPLNLH